VASLLEAFSDADRLRAQADALQRRGFELCRMGEELKAEAVELRTDADRLERESAGLVARRPALVDVSATPDHDAVFLARVADLLGQAGGMTVSQIAEHLGTSRLRVKAACRRGEEAGALFRTGQTRGTRFHRVEAEPDRAGEPVRLHVFTKTMPARELEDREVAWTTEAPAHADD